MWTKRLPPASAASRGPLLDTGAIHRVGSPAVSRPSPPRISSAGGSRPGAIRAVQRATLRQTIVPQDEPWLAAAFTSTWLALLPADAADRLRISDRKMDEPQGSGTREGCRALPDRPYWRAGPLRSVRAGRGSSARLGFAG
jgi:hypothetical protein